MFLTPVVYPLSQIPPSLHWAVYANPPSAPIEAFRWSLLRVGTAPVLPLIWSVTLTTALLVVAVIFFNESEAATIDDF